MKRGNFCLLARPSGGGVGDATLLLLFIFRVRSQFSVFCYLEFFNFGTLENSCKKVQNNSNKIWICQKKCRT